MIEFYASVTYYGIGSILRRYSGFPQVLPLPVSVQHGWTLTPIEHDARRDAPENWYWSASIEAEYKAAFPGIRSRAVGAPFLYLLELENYRTLSSSRRSGSIVFPSHSSSLIEMSCDFDEYAEVLWRLPSAFKPITICMYYLDRERNLDVPFLKRGFEVVTNGTGMYDEGFLADFVRNSADKLYAFSNQMTSALPFASAMGLTAFFFGPRFQVQSSDPNYRHLDYTEHHRTWESRFADSFRFPDCDVAQQRELVDEVLGATSVLSRSQMQKVLWQLILSPKYWRRALSDSYPIEAYRHARKRLNRYPG